MKQVCLPLESFHLVDLAADGRAACVGAGIGVEGEVSDARVVQAARGQDRGLRLTQLGRVFLAR